MRVVINALPFKQQSSGIGILIYELFGALIRNSEQEFLRALIQGLTSPVPMRPRA